MKGASKKRPGKKRKLCSTEQPVIDQILVDEDNDNSRSLFSADTVRQAKKKSGGFQSMGLSQPVIKGVLKRGYRIPTPIQRKAIPLILEGRDVVAMARTGSGKTAAFLLPLLEKLKAHSAQTGARALVLSPTRELAFQTHRFIKELGKFTDLKSAVILGGDNMEDQFAAVHENPDVLIATPGRFLHLLLEMELKLMSVQYVVFDEADRLFEMGFREQLQEILHRLPEHRQTLLFSATLPRMLVDFAQAGLSDPILVRLDVESKLSDLLRTVYLMCRTGDKAAILVHLLRRIVKPNELTVVFVATKHHVEYLREVLEQAGVSCAWVYSSLDQAARKIHVAKFRARKVPVLLVTDVAARGIDIPLLDNAVNYNFPPTPKLFVHRVGRVARAGQSGTAYSLVAPDEAPYLLDLHLFLGRPPRLAGCSSDDASSDGLCGRVPQSVVDEEAEALRTFHERSIDLKNMEHVCQNAMKQYLKSRPPPSAESVRRVKQLLGPDLPVHTIFTGSAGSVAETPVEASLLEGMKKFKPRSTIFEIGSTAKNTAFSVMKKKRESHDGLIKRLSFKTEDKPEPMATTTRTKPQPMADETVIEHAFSTVIGSRKGKRKSGNSEQLQKPKKQQKADFRDPEFYIPHTSSDFHSEKGLGMEKPFEQQASGAVLDLTADDDQAMKKERSRMKWDRKKKRFVRDICDDPKKKKVRTESGAWIPASYKTDLYKQWKKKSMVDSRDDDEDTAAPKTPACDWLGKRHHGTGKRGGNQKGCHKELRTKEEILKMRKRRARLESHTKKKHAQRAARRKNRG